MIQPLSRRRLLALLTATAAAGRLSAQSTLFGKRRKAPLPTPTFVYFGTDTLNSPSKGIYLARFDTAKGQLSTPTLAAETLRPSFMAVANVGKHRVLYAANEGNDEASSGVSSFLIDPTTGALTFLNKVSAAGAGPCYVSVDSTGSCAFAANYSGGSIASFRVKPDGSLSDPVDRIDFRQSAFGHHGPNAARQDAPHPHSGTISPDNRFLVVNDLGNDNIVTFSIDSVTAHLGPPQLNEARTPGAGPRHIAFHPNGRWAYGINELTSTVEHYLWNTTHGTGATSSVALLTEAGTSVSTLDNSFHHPNTAAEIVLSPDGNFLIVSNRGENSLVVFRIDAASGGPAPVQRIACGGKTPRQFTLDPTGRWLLCGNQDSNLVTVFARDQSSGQLTGPVQTLSVDMPQMILFG